MFVTILIVPSLNVLDCPQHFIWFVIKEFNMAARPIMFSDWLKFQKSPSQKPHVWWNCSVGGMFYLWHSNMYWVFLAIRNARWPPPQVESFNTGIWTRHKIWIEIIFSKKQQTFLNWNRAGITLSEWVSHKWAFSFILIWSPSVNRGLNIKHLWFIFPFWFGEWCKFTRVWLLKHFQASLN